MTLSSCTHTIGFTVSDASIFFVLSHIFFVDGVDEHQNGDEFDDNASNQSSSSSSSVRDCKVILQRENFDEILKASADNGRAVGHSTRARSSSQLTEENVAAHLNPARRALRSASVASDGTGSTKSRTTRTSTRLAASQNTPKKESGTPSRPATPSRRSSRLLSENEKTVDSPAKRTLRSNSVASVDDTSPPPLTRTRSSSRLSETQGTPGKALKTQVSKIKTEPITPRRASSRVNKSSVMSEIIDEESSDDDKPKKGDKKAMHTVQEEEKTVAENQAEPDSSMQVEHEDANSGAVAQQEDHSAIDKSPLVSVIVNDKTVEPETTEPINSEKPTVSITVNAVGAVEILDSDTPIEQKADTPTVEPAEPMEISMVEYTEEAETPIENELAVVDENRSTTLQTSLAMNEIDSAVPTTANEKTAKSPGLNKSKNQTEQQQPSVMMGTVQVKIEAPTDMDTDDVSQSANIDDTLTEILKSYSPKPKSKARQSEAFKSMDVSALIQNEEVSSPAPVPVSPSKQLKVATKRLSLNSSVQSTGFDKMEATALDADIAAVEKAITDEINAQEAAEEVNMNELANANAKSPQRKTRLSIQLMSCENTPVCPKELEPSTARTTPKPVTPMQTVPESTTPKSVTAKSNATPKKTPIAVQPTGLTPFFTPMANKDFDNSFNRIADRLTPGPNESAINRHIADIVANMTIDSPMLESATVDPNVEDEPENFVDAEDNSNEQSIESDQNDASVVDKTQADLDETTSQTEEVQQEEPKSIVKSVRKSVQIMTPKNEKTHSAEKRIDTPYPTAATIQENNSPSELDDGNKNTSDGEISFVLFV